MRAKIILLLLLFIIKIEVHAQAPSISSFTPAVGTIGYTIVLKGSGFTGATVVSFGGVAASSFTVVDDATINAVLGTGNSGNVVVATPRGSSTVAGFSYCTGVTPSVTITATQLSVAPNTNVTFTASITNGGVAPNYQWFKNGNAINGAYSSTYNLSSISNRDSFWVFLNSNAACTIVNGATSNKLTMYVSDRIINTVAGNGTASWSGDGGSATAASLNGPTGIVLDKAGNLYIAERNNHDVRKVTPSGIISRVVGNGNAVFGGDGGLALYASLSSPTGVAVDKTGNLFIADNGNNRIRKVDVNGIISTIAGDGKKANIGENISAIAASIKDITSIAIDTIGNLFIVDTSSNTIRKINTNGIISTVAGKNPSNYADFGVPAINASILPTSIAVDYLGNIYIAESGIGRISKINTNGLLYRLAGYGSSYSDGISGLSVHLNFVIGISVDTLGNIFFVEGSNWNQGQKIRLLGTNGIINTIAGLGNSNSDGLYALNVSLNNAYATAFDAAGNLYFSEEGTNRVRKVAEGVPNSALPLTLTTFSATTINQNIKTIWQTASEQNTSHFNIQRSSDGIAFATIGTVSALGSGANNYSFIDEHPNYGINYYRLQSMDKDGSFVYSKTVSATITDKRYFSIVPNPARDFATINFSKPVENTSVRVYDITGKPLMVNAVPRNTTSYKLNVQSLPNGFYIIHVNTPTANYTEKLLINK
jgi:hypothetical protein